LNERPSANLDDRTISVTRPAPAPRHVNHVLASVLLEITRKHARVQHSQQAVVAEASGAHAW
jgi:hypothetical protein